MSATRIQGLAGDYTGDFIGTPITLNTAMMAEGFVNLSAMTGSGLHFSLFVQASNDGGTTWFDTVLDQIIELADSYTTGTVRTNERDIIKDKTATGASKYWFRIKQLAADMVRFRGKLSGTTPAITITGDITVK